MSLRRILKKGFESLANEISKPESFHKGEAFEEYVRNVMFPKSDYKLLHKTHNYETNKGDFVESSLLPDFKFLDPRTKRTFYVEAKWRSGTFNNQNKLEWCSESQLERYLQIDKYEGVVFIALGIGGKPEKPEDVVLFPVANGPYTGLYDSFIENYLFYVNKPVFSGYLWGL